MAEEMTPGEIARALARIEEGQKELRAEITRRLDRTVSTDIYTVQHQGVLDEIAELKGEISEARKEVKATESQRVVDRRFWLTAVAIPIASLVLTYLVPLLGGGVT